MSNKSKVVISVFDGISCGMVALGRAGIKVKKYYASEVKQTAIKVSKYNYPGIVHVGDCRYVSVKKLDDIPDLIIGGSPCKGISGLNKNQDGLDHQESTLFWEYLRLLDEIREINPDVEFILENTHGSKKATDEISRALGVLPISINSKLVSAQNRPRYYWTNIKGVTQPKDLGITTHDIILNRYKTHSDLIDPGLIVPENRIKWLKSESGIKSVKKAYTRIDPYPKTSCISANGHRTWNENYVTYGDGYRFLSRQELEMLQTLPIGYTRPLNYEDAYDVIGDGWTVDVVAHILSFAKLS